MFGGSKPTFGSTGTGFGSFNNAAATSPFGQTAFGKPATSAFGGAPAFGAQQTPMFGAPAAQPQQTGLFGVTNPTAGFGAAAPAQQPAFGGAFSQPQQNTSIFGATQQAASASLFTQQPTSAFASTVKPAGLSGFGQAAAPAPASLFGQATTTLNNTSFGAFGQTAPPTNAFGGAATSAFGQQAVAPGGANPGSSIIKYNPTMGTDTLMKGGQTNNVNTKQHCITAMKEYETKSLEELRMEDYLANRKGPQAGPSGAGGFFGAAAQPAAGAQGIFGATAQPNTGLFGQQQQGAADNKSIFGTSAFGQPANTSFGAPANQNSFMAKPFGVATTTGFGTTTTDSANPFGPKPSFGQPGAPSMFGQQQQPAAAAPAFGQQPTTGFGGFGAAQPGAQQPTLFGQPAGDANKPAFGLGAVSTANTGFGGFGATATSTANTGLFGTKPATGFGTLPAFGATSTANTGFSNFTMNQPAGAGAGLFNTSMNKPATTGFGAFGAQQQAAPLNFNTGNTNNSLFGNMAAKPGGMFGNTLGNPAGTANCGGMFGGGTGAFGTSLGGGGGFGTNTMGGGNMTLGGMVGGGQQPVVVPIHQQILSKVTSPYGDNPIYKDLKRNDETDATRATNPAAQKAILENSSASAQFKVSTKSSPIVVKVRPICNTATTKKSLFDGLEESDPNLETFTLKPNAKRLNLKPKNGTEGGSSTGSGSLGGGGHMPLRQTNNVNASLGSGVRNESFSGEIPTEISPQANAAGATAGGLVGAGAGAASGGGATTKDHETSRRESWLHPNNLEKVRQMNAAGAGSESPTALNNTLSELMPRKPLDTYRSGLAAGGGGGGARLSVSTVPENPFEDETSSISRRDTLSYSDHVNESVLSSRSYGADERSVVDELAPEYEEHPTGITLRRIGYYTIPSLDELKSYLAEDSSCVVPNFTIGREGYGNVYFGKQMDVAGLNLDEIVHFRNKQVIIYPDDDNKPSIGNGLNREAQVTLDQVWPHDKDKHELIKDPLRLADMDWEGKLRRICDKNDTRFVDYRPETGSWVFRVKHFSKYGLSDSDEDDEPLPTDPKKAKMGVMLPGQRGGVGSAPGDAAAARKGMLNATATQKGAQKIADDGRPSMDPKMGGFYPMDESAEFMLMDKTQYFQRNGHDYSMFDQSGKAGIGGSANYEVPSPTAALARASGTDSHKLQLMKASLFVDDEPESKAITNELEEADQNRSLFGVAGMGGGGRGGRDSYGGSSHSLWKDVGGGAAHSETSSQLDFGVNASSMHAASSAASVLSVIRETQSETSSPAPGTETTVAAIKPAVKLPPFIVKPKVAAIRSLASQVPFLRSIAYPLRDKWPCDLGLYNSRQFKVGFGPQNTLIVPTTRENANGRVQNEHLCDAVPRIFKLRSQNDFTPTLLQHVKIASAQHYPNFGQSIIDHLQIQLRNSMQEDVDDSECPWIRSEGGTDLIVKHLDEAIKQINLGPLEEYAVSVWSLCLAMWGEHEEMEGRESNSHFVVMCRRNLLSEWLENTITDKDLLTKSVSKHTYLDHMIELIMCHKVTEACELAFRYDDANLALLLSQLSSGPAVRQLMEDQLAAWHKDEADTFIQLERLKLFMLVAGVSLMNSAHGPINTLEGIEWIKVLAIQLWYLSSPTASITDALLSYEKTFKAEEFYSLPPVPAYLEKPATESFSSEKSTLHDLRYHLLQLYSKRSHPMESLLNPATHTADPMDYRLSWLILQTLEALGYRHCSTLSEAQLHVGFAAQLENYGLWEWSVFVLLHIKQRNQRELAVQNMLYRYVSVSPDVALSDKEKFVMNNLGVPEKWIDYAKAVRAGAMGHHHLQAKYLLKAKQWSLAHEIIFQHIAPDAIINDNLEYLHELLVQFEGADVQQQKSAVKVPNWSNQGQIFLDFIDINEKFKSLKTLKTPADIETRWENLKPQLADLCSRINLLPCPTAKHRLCQSEIAQNLACLIRGVLVVCPALNPCMIIKIALERLPLPQEFAQQELRALLDALVTDLAKAYTGGNSLELAVK